MEKSQLKRLDDEKVKQKCPFNHESLRSINWLIKNSDDIDELIEKLKRLKCYGYHAVLKEKGRIVILNCQKKDDEKEKSFSLNQNENSQQITCKVDYACEDLEC